MAVRKLFISHSSKTDASLQDLHEICLKLQAHDNDCHVLVDKSGEIYPSEDWEKRLDEWLAECHAAVILVTKAALQSWWVLKEATILKWRWQLDPNFNHLFIVLLDGLDAGVFEQEPYKTINFQQIQFITDHDDNPDNIVAKVEAELAKIQPTDTTFDRVKGAISGNLQKVDSAAVIQACQDLQIEERLEETVCWSGSDNAPQAEALARLMLRENHTSLKFYNDVIDAISPPLHHDWARSLYETIYPLWVCEEAAVQLPLSWIENTPGMKRLALNGKKLRRFTAESFVRRANPLSKDWLLIPVAKIHTNAKSITAEIRKYFREEVIDDPDASDEETDEEIESFPSPVYILLPENLIDETMLDELQLIYKSAVFLLCAGQLMPPADALPAKTRAVMPPVDIELEQQQSNQMNRSRNLLKKLPGGAHT